MFTNLLQQFKFRKKSLFFLGLILTLTSVLSTAYAQGVTRYYTDFGGYYTSNTASATSSTWANGRSNVIAFEAGGVTYSTGVNDATLTAHSITFTPGNFQGFVVTNIVGNTSTAASSNFLAYGKAIDGDAANPVYNASSVVGQTTRDVLSDGIHGLDLATGVTNINMGTTITFPVGCVKSDAISDTAPDIYLVQIADLSGTDVYSFRDASGNIVGTGVSPTFNSPTNPIGRWALDLFTLAANSPYNTTVPSSNGSNGNPYRDIRMVAYKLSDFGITTANFNQIASFRYVSGGGADPAFFSYNANSISVSPLVAGTVSANQSVCYNSPATVALTGSTGTIQWQQSSNGTTGWVNVTGGTGATTATYVTDNLIATTYYRAVVSNGVCAPVISGVTAVSINSTNSWTGVTSSDWNTASNWSCNAVPTADLDANIPVVGTGFYPILSSSIGTSRNLNIASGASVNVTGSGVLRVAGAINNTGILNVVDGSIRFVGTTGAQVIPTGVFETNYVKNININNTAGVTVQGPINITGILTLVNGTFHTGDQVTLKSNGFTTAIVAPVSNGIVDGTMTIERFIPSRRAFRFLTSPVDGGTIQNNWQEGGTLPDPVGLGTDITGAGGATNGFDVSGSNSPSLFTYLNNNPNPAQSSWVAVANTNVNTLTAGTPYRILVRGDREVDQASNAAPSSVTTLRTTGTIRIGDQIVPDLNLVDTKTSFIGNPYQAPVDMAAVLLASTSLNKDFYYVWDPQVSDRGAYVTVNFGQFPGDDENTNVSSSADRYLQPAQACFVTTDLDGINAPSMTFKEGQKQISTTTTAIFRTQDTGEHAKIRLTLYDTDILSAAGPAADGLLVVFDPNYTNELDNRDANKPTNQDEGVGSVIGDKILSYQSRNMPLSTDVIALSNKQYRRSQYTYVANVSGLSTTPAYLYDGFNDSYTEMANGITNIPFNVDSTNPASIAENRFQIVFQTQALGNNENDLSAAVSVYPNPITEGQFFVNVPSSGKYAVTLTSILGQEIASRIVVNGNTLQVLPSTQLAAGVYMVQVSNGVLSTTKKIIVK